MLRLPLVAELGDGLLLAVGNEHRIEPEPGAAGRRLGDPALERAGATHLLPIRRQRDQLTDIPRAATRPCDPFQLAQGPPHLVAGSAAGGVHAGAAAEPGDLEPGVLTKGPRAGRRARAAEARLGDGVRVVRVGVLGWIVVRVERLDHPSREQPLELARLVRIPRSEQRFYSLHRTSATSSTSAIVATRSLDGRSRGSLTSSSSRRRSASWLTSIVSMRAPPRSTSSITVPGPAPTGSSTSSR